MNEKKEEERLKKKKKNLERYNYTPQNISRLMQPPTPIHDKRRIPQNNVPKRKSYFLLLNKHACKIKWKKIQNKMVKIFKKVRTCRIMHLLSHCLLDFHVLLFIHVLIYTLIYTFWCSSARKWHLSISLSISCFYWLGF